MIEQRDKLRNLYTTETVSKAVSQEIIVNEQDKRFKEQLDIWLSNKYHSIKIVQ